MGILHTYYKTHTLKTARCIVSLCPIYYNSEIFREIHLNLFLNCNAQHSSLQEIKYSNLKCTIAQSLSNTAPLTPF